MQSMRVYTVKDVYKLLQTNVNTRNVYGEYIACGLSSFLIMTIAEPV